MPSSPALMLSALDALVSFQLRKWAKLFQRGLSSCHSLHQKCSSSPSPLVNLPCCPSSQPSAVSSKVTSSRKPP